MNKSLVKRIRKIEKRTFQPRWRVVVKDFDGLYRGECGEGLSEAKFDDWVKQQDLDTQVIIVEFNENMPAAPFEKEHVTLKVENYCDKNTSDFLKNYEELIQFSRSPETEIIAKSVENQISGVDPNCGCFTPEQAKLIAQAQEIKKNALLH